MMRRLEIMSRIAGTAVALALIWAPVAAAQGDDDNVPGSKKLQRQVDVLERFASQMLLDSPNFLVSGGQAARGIYLDCFGVLVTFNASLLEKDDDKDWNWWKGKWKIKRDGDKIIVIPEDGKSDEGQEFSYDEWMEKKQKHQARVYDRGKQEIIDLLLDYGDTITRLKDDQWVAVAAFLRESDYLEEEGISHLVVKAKSADLRAYGAGDIDEKAMTSRMVVEEY